MKNITIFHLKIIIFTVVKYCNILHGHVFVMSTLFALALMSENLGKYKYMYIKTSEPRHEKTNVLVSDLVRHKPGCTATEDG